jgi:hypothetical protein
VEGFFYSNWERKYPFHTGQKHYILGVITRGRDFQFRPRSSATYRERSIPKLIQASGTEPSALSPDRPGFMLQNNAGKPPQQGGLSYFQQQTSASY